MSFAVIKTGGKQYKVKASDILKIERLKESKAESKIAFNELFANDIYQTIYEKKTLSR